MAFSKSHKLSHYGSCIQLLKMYRLRSKSPGEQEHPRLEGWEFKNSLTERKHGTVIFLTLRQWTKASTKPDFCFLLSLMATFDLESVSDLGLHLSKELLRVLVEPALLATKQYQDWNNTLKQHKTLKRNLEPIPVTHTCSLPVFKLWILIKQDHQWNPTPKEEKPWTVYLCWWARKEWICLGCVEGVKRGKRLEGSGKGGVGKLIRWDQ